MKVIFKQKDENVNIGNKVLRTRAHRVIITLHVKILYCLI